MPIKLNPANALVRALVAVSAPAAGTSTDQRRSMTELFGSKQKAQETLSGLQKRGLIERRWLVTEAGRDVIARMEQG